MASNSIVAVNEGDSQIIAESGDFPNTTGETEAGEGKTADARPDITKTRLDQRESGDHVNRFLLCTLVSESAKRIKESAEKAGESLPMTMIVRGVLRSYLLAAENKYGPLAKTEPDIAGLKRLNEKVLKNELARHSRDRVKNSQTRLAHAQRLGDDTRIKTEKENLERAIELRDRLSTDPH